MNLAYLFNEAVRSFTGDEQQTAACWNELETAYSLPERHYHNLEHIRHMLILLDEVKAGCADLQALQLAVFYHDIIYDVQRNDNEAESAAIAGKRLAGLGFKRVGKVTALILSTQKHEAAADQDTNYLLDIDLSILGAHEAAYKRYAEQVREEYRIYPDEVYNPGRIRVLQHFLDAAPIFKTDYFYQQLEAQARKNINKEIAQLSGKY